VKFDCVLWDFIISSYRKHMPGKQYRGCRSIRTRFPTQTMAMRFLRHHDNELKRLLIACECHEQVPLERNFASLDLPKEKVESLIGELSECKCCPTHSSYCPPCLIPGDGLPETPEDQKRTDKEKGITFGTNGMYVSEPAGCQCRCRHYARTLCRAYGHLSDIADFEDFADVEPMTNPIFPLPLPPVKMAVSSLVN
jgi:hypothetical protein